MKVSDNEGLANHIGPESCVDDPQGRSEALTGERAGWVLSPETDMNPSADGFQMRGRQHTTNRYGKAGGGSAGSETPCMHGSTLSGNREALRLAAADCTAARMENSERGHGHDG